MCRTLTPGAVKATLVTLRTVINYAGKAKGAAIRMFDWTAATAQGTQASPAGGVHLRIRPHPEVQRREACQGRAPPDDLRPFLHEVDQSLRQGWGHGSEPALSASHRSNTAHPDKIAVVSKMLNHADISTTVRYYAKHNPDLVRDLKRDYVKRTLKKLRQDFAVGEKCLCRRHSLKL
jgi:hypothetical protein